MQQAGIGIEGSIPHTLQVTVPANAPPNSMLEVTDPLTNQRVQFLVPPGAYPGQVINVQVSPVPVQPTTVVYQQAPQPVVMGTPTTVIVKERHGDAAAESCLGTLAACCLVCACCELMSAIH